MLLCSFLNVVTRWGMGGQGHGPAALPQEATRYPRLDECGKPRPPHGFYSRTVQPVASCYTNYAAPDHAVSV